MSSFYCFRSARLWLSLALCCLSVTLAMAQTIRYVKPAATGSGDGSSWANASGNLQRTIDRSAPDDQVWVATGVYKPTRIPPGLDPTDERNKTFFFSNGVNVFGGFDGTETAIDQRDLTGPSSTTLSGDLGKPASITISDGSADYVNYDDNSNSVVTIRGSSKTVLDGFIITSGSGSLGGGILNDGSSRLVSSNIGSRPLIRNCYISNNIGFEGGGIAEIGGTQNSGATYINCVINNNAGGMGGGLYCEAWGTLCSPSFINCQFLFNNSPHSGGGAYIMVIRGGICNPTFTNTIFRNNVVVSDLGQDGDGGGALYLKGESGDGIINARLTGCLIDRNEAKNGLKGYGADFKRYGGAVYSSDVKGSITLTNCTVTGNDTYRGNSGFMYAAVFSNQKPSFSVNIKNSILYNNGSNQYSSPYTPSVTYSIIQKDDSFLSGKGNINGNTIMSIFSPQGRRLYATSPGVNAGDPNTNPKDLPATDLDGNPRFQGRIDIGAYERDVLPNRPPVALTHPDETATVGIPMLSGGQEAFFVDPEDKPLTLTAAGLPASLSLIRNSAGSYAISGTPKTAGVSSVTLIAKDPEGLADTLTFQLVVDTAPVAFQLTGPVYDCQTGAFTFKTTGGDGSPIEYQAAGITGWTSNPNQYVDQGLRTANDVQPFTLMARQKGVVVSYSWNLKAACGRARLAASEATDRLLVSVLGNPVMGESAQVAISGADGQSLTLSLADAAGNVVSAERIEQATTETRTIRLGQSAGVYLLRASTPAQSWTVRIVKQ